MRKKWKKTVAAFVAAAMLGGVVHPFLQRAEMETYAAEEKADTLPPDMEKNLNYQNYGVYGGMVSSYLVETDGGYMRVQDIGDRDAPVVEYYDEQFQLKSQMYLEKELDGFAGFYAGGDYYYVAWVQFLPSGIWAEDKPFLRITKYDKNWKELAHTDIASENLNDYGVVYPGESGSLRMDEYKGHLYVHTCYEGIDFHQRSVMFDIVEADMSLVELEANGIADYYGKASHSFNQFLMIDDGLTPKRMVTLHQGDGGEKRGAALFQSVLYTDYPSALSPDDQKLVNVLEAAGGDYRDQSGNVNNFVGMSLGGLEQSKTSYLVAGNSIEQVEETFLTAKQRNIFVTATSRTNFTKDNTTLTWLTDYKEGDGVTVSTPQLVKLNDNLFLVMWRVGAQADYIAGELNYTFVDGNGNRCLGALGQTYTVGAEITDCKPIVKDGKALWYSSGVEGVYFYGIDTQGSFEKHGVNTMENIPVLKKAEMQENGTYFEWEPVEGASGYRIIRRYKTEPGMDYCLDVEGGRTDSYLDTKMNFQDNCSYDYFVCALGENGVPSYASNVINRWMFRGLYYGQVSLENADGGVRVSWNSLFEKSFHIYRSSADGTDEKLIATVEGPSLEDYTPGIVQTYVDTTAKSGEKYDYSIAAYQNGHESKRYNKHSIICLSLPQLSAESTVHKGLNSITLSWDEVPGTEKYSVYSYVWDEQAGRYKSHYMDKEFGSDGFSCVFYGASEGKKYQFRVLAKSGEIKTLSMKNSDSFSSAVAVLDFTYTRPEGDSSVPDAPSFGAFYHLSDGVGLRWLRVKRAQGYELSIKDDATGTIRTVEQIGDEYTDTQVSEGKSYTYKIRSYVENDGVKVYSGWSEEKQVTWEENPESPPEVSLSAPSITSLENGEDCVRLSWTPVENADGYEITAYDSIQGSRTVVCTRTECEDLKVADGVTYTYKVRAYAGNYSVKICGPWSEDKSITFHKPVTEEELPVVVTATSFTSMESKSEGVRLAWTLVDGADGYEIQEKNSVNVRVRTLSADADDYTGTEGYLYAGTITGATYTYKIRTYVLKNGIKTYSDWSEEKSIDYKKPAGLPTPKNLSAKNTENGVALTWDPVEGATEYHVYRYSSPDAKPGDYDVSARQHTTETGCTDTTAEEGKTYYYMISAYGENDDWSDSTERVGIQYENPQTAAPDLGRITILEDQQNIRVEWTPVDGADSYSVCYYEAGTSGNTYFCKRVSGADASSTEFMLPVGSDGKTYYFYVVAYNGDVASKPSGKAAKLIPELPTPNAPDLRNARCFRDENGSGIELSWTPGEADGYKVYAYKAVDTKLVFAEEMEIKDGKSDSCRFYGLEEGITYFFQMKAYCVYNFSRKISDFSNGKIIAFTTPSEITDPTDPIDPVDPVDPVDPTDPDTLKAPKLVEVKCVSGGIKLTWEPVEGAEGYFVKWCKAKSPQEVFIQRVEGQDTVSFLHQYVYLTEGETYIYSVAAYTNTPDYKISGYSEEKSIVYQKVTDVQPVMRGDADGDGEITVNDALSILKHVAEIKNNVFIMEAADCDKDGSVTVDDALMVLKHVAGIINLKA